MVTVPDFSACESWIACNEAATRAGLTAQQQIATNLQPGMRFTVLGVSPPAGTSVPEGTVVTITTQPAKVIVIARPWLKDTLQVDKVRIAALSRLANR